MALSKNDAPANADKALQEITDAGAGVPPQMKEAAEALPERDDVEVGVKKSMLAEDAQSEAKAKLDVVKASRDAPDTPSGFALGKTANIADNVERGEAYAREKSAKRHGYVPAEESK